MLAVAHRVLVAKWVAAAFVLSVIDGAFLGGVAAVISAAGTLILGLLAYRKGHKTAAAARTPDAEEWRIIAEEKAKIAAAWKELAQEAGAFDE